MAVVKGKNQVELKIESDGMGQDRAIVNSSGIVSSPAGLDAGAAANQGIVPLTLSKSATASGTGADTTEDTLFTYTLPANALSANGQGVRLRAWGSTAANANNKTLKMYFGTTAVVSQGATAANAKDWYFEMTVLRTGAAAEVTECHGSWNGATVQPVVSASPTESLTAAVVIKITGTNGTSSANDLTFKGAVLELVN